ncbi:MAG: LptA/OstA family protein [Thermodesulfobacteriota bacterium]
MNTFACRLPMEGYGKKMRALLCAFVYVVVTSLFAYADDKPLAGAGADKESERIHITSDSLVTDNNANYAEFIGNVSATQGTTLITSDKLRIYYQVSGTGKEKKITSQDAVKRIVATGNVTIRFDNKVAVTEQAEYITDTGMIILTGANSRVTSGSNYVAGDKITLYRFQDKVTVERSKEKRVEAVFYPSEKGPNP